MNKDKIDYERIDRINQALPQAEKRYFWQLFIAFDQLINTLLGGWADETLSSRSYRMAEHTGHARWKIVRNTIDTIFALFGDYNHCENAFMNEYKRTHSPDLFRNKDKKQ